MTDRSRRLTDAYSIGIYLREKPRSGTSLYDALSSVDGPYETLDDGYPDWHPVPYSFHGMVILFLYRDITGHSYRPHAQYPDLSDVFGLVSIPNESVLSHSKRITSSEQEVIKTMEADEQEVAVESASVHVESGSHPMRFLHVPSTRGEGTAVFATNLSVGPDEAETFCRRYSRRWQIENEYESIKGDFLSKTSSKDCRVRLFYFVFAVLLYNIWRLTDFLLKAGVGGEMDYAPVLTAGECVEMVASALIPPD